MFLPMDQHKITCSLNKNQPVLVTYTTVNNWLQRGVYIYLKQTLNWYSSIYNSTMWCKSNFQRTKLGLGYRSNCNKQVTLFDQVQVLTINIIEDYHDKFLYGSSLLQMVCNLIQINFHKPPHNPSTRTWSSYCKM